MNAWSWVMGAVPLFSLLAGISGLLILGICLMTGLSARKRLAAIDGLLKGMVCGYALFVLIAVFPAPVESKAMKFGPSRLELEDQIVRANAMSPEDQQAKPPFPALFDRRLEEKRGNLPPVILQTYAMVGGLLLVGMVGARFLVTALILARCRKAPDWMREMFREVEVEQFGRSVLSVTISDAATVPWSAFRTVAMPAESVEWDREDVRLALAHEAAHLRELHYVTLGLAYGFGCFAWFMPWMWFLPSKLKGLMELAADEAVIGTGADPARYADLLLRIGKASVVAPRAALPMVNGKDMKMRIEKILNQTSNGKTNRTSSFVLGAVGAVVLGSLAALSSRAYAQPLLPQANSQAQDNLRRIEIKSQPLALSPANNFSGVDADGKRVSLSKLTMKRGGEIQDWTQAQLWQMNPQQDWGNMNSFYDNGGVSMEVTVEEFGVQTPARAYSLEEKWVQSWDGMIHVGLRKDVAQTGKLTLVYSRAPWTTVATARPTAGRLTLQLASGVRGNAFANAAIRVAPEDFAGEQFVIDYGQIATFGSAVEFVFDDNNLDRSVTDQQVLFWMKDGTVVKTREFTMNKTGKRVKAHRAHVEMEDIDSVRIEQRPVKVVTFTDLPSAE